LRGAIDGARDRAMRVRERAQEKLEDKFLYC